MKCDFCLIALEHPRRTICEKCENAWNKGARWADAHWSRLPKHYMEMYGGRNADSESAYHNPNAVYARARNYQDGDKE